MEGENLGASRERAIGNLNDLARAFPLIVREILPYIQALEAQASYLTGQVVRYEKALGPREHEEPYIEPRLSVVRGGSGERAFLHPHRDRQVALVKLSHGGVEGTPPPAEDDFLPRIEELDNPLAGQGAAPVEVDREPKAVLDTAGMQGGELLGGAGGHESGGRHGGHLSLKDVTDLIERVSRECREEIFKDAASTKTSLPGGDFGALIAVRKSWKFEAISRLKDLLLAEMKTSL